MRRRHLGLIAIIVLLGLWLWSKRLGNSDVPVPAPTPATQVAEVVDTQAARAPALDSAARYPDFLPVEAHDVLDRIAAGGPFAHRQDGGVFQNRERRLPPRPGGYYREYTVVTPGSDDRGARRIITGGDPPVEYWYSDDHYRSFRRFEVANAGTAR
ncbi:guanyl-specific ribonuclease Sa [Lysobacter niastensis]|uniref:Guanyl-specific ribonuclease Sa n=1 Tax=Lysobacter niastensis TaxID=380629 RepID=A0ABU1W5J7_9GAMM|nr:ribonuclease domain-containing protein [Lysobacter niastensis]MDR7132863.1 guanyl-specific ribonuclease Sa [Lysobacter niastensis]